MDPSPSSASASPAPPPRRATSSPSSGPRRSLKRHKALGAATSAAAIAAARAVVVATVATIVAGAPLATSYSDIYANTERLCRGKHQEMSQLADAVLAEIGAGFSAEWQPHLRRSVTTTGGAAEFITVLSRWQAISETLSKVLLPLDRGYLHHHSTKPSIRRRCMMLVAEEIQEHTAVLNQWHLEMVVVKQPVTSAAMSQLVFQVSEALPEAKLRTSVLERLALVYTERGHQWLTTEPNYVARCLSEIASEISYWQRCGYPQSFINDLRKRLKWAVVFSHFDAVAAAVLPQLLVPGAGANSTDVTDGAGADGAADSTLIKALVAMCRAASDDYGYDAVAALRHQAQSFLTRQFDDVIATHTRRKRFVSDLVSAYHQWRHRFAAFTDAEPRLEYAWRQSFAQAVNSSAHVGKHVALHLCRHCDAWFKHHPTPWAEFKREVLVVFEALNAKSAFVASYRQFVAKRLLSVDGVGPDYVSEERGVVDGFAGVIGDDDANIVAIRRMVTDWATSRDQYSHLYANDDDVNPDNIDVNVLVLRHDDWRDVPKPTGTPALVVPPVFQKLVHRFAQDYAATSQRHQRQRLDWTNWWTHKVTLAVAFDRGTREVQGNMVHASVVALLCAGGDPQPQYTEAELTTKLGVEAATTERIVSPLVDKGLIVCDPTTQLLRWNFAFDDGSDKKIKLSVGKDKASAAPASAAPSEAGGDAANADAAELAARRHQLQCQCVLMRVMKQEQRLGYAQLMHRCLDYFEAQGQSVSPRQLKREMDALLAADDLKRLDNGDIEYVP